MACRYFIGREGKAHRIAIDYGFIIYRFFVIILLAVTIIWVPVVQTEYCERLFEYTHAVMSYLTPPIAAIFRLAVFCKRVTEQVSRC